MICKVVTGVFPINIPIINVNKDGRSRPLFLLFSYSSIMGVVDGLVDCVRETSFGCTLGS